MIKSVVTQGEGIFGRSRTVGGDDLGAPTTLPSFAAQNPPSLTQGGLLGSRDAGLLPLQGGEDVTGR